MTTREQNLTRDEFLQWAAQHAHRRFQRVDGEIVEKVPTQIHALIANLLNAVLYLYIRQHPTAWVFSEVRIALPDDDQNDRVPDIAVARREGRTVEANAPLPYVPELVIEIQSPGQSDKFMIDHAAYYLENGGAMVWLIYPAKRLVEVLTPADRQLLTEGDDLTGGDVLPGFTLSVRDIFTVEG